MLRQKIAGRLAVAVRGIIRDIVDDAYGDTGLATVDGMRPIELQAVGRLRREDPLPPGRGERRAATNPATVPADVAAKVLAKVARSHREADMLVSFGAVTLDPGEAQVFEQTVDGFGWFKNLVISCAGPNCKHAAGVLVTNLVAAGLPQIKGPHGVPVTMFAIANAHLYERRQPIFVGQKIGFRVVNTTEHQVTLTMAALCTQLVEANGVPASIDPNSLTAPASASAMKTPAPDSVEAAFLAELLHAGEALFDGDGGASLKALLVGTAGEEHTDALVLNEQLVDMMATLRQRRDIFGPPSPPMTRGEEDQHHVDELISGRARVNDPGALAAAQRDSDEAVAAVNERLTNYPWGQDDPEVPGPSDELAPEPRETPEPVEG